MSKEIGLYISRSFIEITIDSKQNKSKRVTYSLNSIDSQLKALLNSMQVNGADCQAVYFQTKLPWVIVEKKIGSSPAFLTTAGIESWLDMNLPQTPAHWTVDLKKCNSLLQKELIFGVSERTGPDGAISQAVTDAELEFLSEKLKMSEVTHIAIGFLHSQINPENEKKAAQFLRAKGFHVYASHEVSSDREERPRFWAALFNAYVDLFLKEKFDLIAKAFSEIGVEPNKIHFCGQMLPQFYDGPRNWFSEKNSIQLNRSNKLKQNKATLFCGLEDFELLGAEPRPLRTTTSLGIVGLKSFFCKTLWPSPFQRLENNFFGALDWSSQLQENESGPMCLGRGAQPTLIDAISSNYNLSDVDGISDRLNDKVTRRISDSFNAYAKSTGSDGPPENEILKSAAIDWACQLKESFASGPIELIGPLAPFVFDMFKKTSGTHLFRQSTTHCDYLSQLVLSQINTEKNQS